VKATILGEEALLRKLTLIPVKLRFRIKAEMADQADEIVAMMKRLVPVEPGKPDLKDTIGWRWGGTAPKGAQSLGTLHTEQATDLRITIHAGNNQTFYATFIEFGTVKMAARPFFFVSWRANRNKAKAAVRAVLRQVAREVSSG
jgi:HK97 gp10 family phage protein